MSLDLNICVDRFRPSRGVEDVQVDIMYSIAEEEKLDPDLRLESLAGLPAPSLANPPASDWGKPGTKGQVVNFAVA